jgi:hypothetical protein
MNIPNHGTALASRAKVPTVPIANGAAGVLHSRASFDKPQDTTP